MSNDLWIIIGSLPVLIFVATFLGFEVSFYYGISILGLAFWMFGNGKPKKIGILICIVGILLFLMAFIYCVGEEMFFPEEAFEFKALTHYLGF